jgi:transposase
MRYAQINTKYYCGVDMHSKTMYARIKDKEGTTLLHGNMPNDFDTVKEFIGPYLPDIAVGVESTCFYYWLADACRKEGIPFYLGHALYMKAISGGKVKNDKIDAGKIADLLRANLFPLAYPYPKEMRATRDLLRRRHRFVSKRAGTYVHLQILCQQYAIIDLPPNLMKKKRERQKLLKLFDNQDLRMIIEADLQYIEALDPIIDGLEKQIIAQANTHNRIDYQLLMTTPGIGPIIALIILYETHNIRRFKTVQRYSSYCGVVKCQRISAGKEYASKNHKIRNAYLKWAFGEIILKAQQDKRIERLYQRLKAKYGKGRAKSIIAHRFCVAIYFMLKNQQPFDVDRFVQSSKY